jgi:hypothetical protein
MARDYQRFTDKNENEEEGVQFPLILIHVYSDGSVQFSGRDDMTLEDAAELMEAVAADIRDSLMLRRAKAKEN